MNILSRAISRVSKAAGLRVPTGTRGSWTPFIREPYSGAWQKNEELSLDCTLAFHAVYACVTRISNSIGKLSVRLMRMDDNGIWSATENPAFSPVLRKPNRYQNHIQFKQWWILSKLVRGNSYALKQRDGRGVVNGLWLLDPCRVTVLVASDGSVFYQLGSDNLNGVESVSLTVPASEIIHDRMNCLFHPLVGVAPMFACGLAASQGIKMQRDAALFFANGANPGGVLTAPATIDEETAKRLQESWKSNYTGENAGKIAVMGDGLKFEPMRMSYVDAQMIEQQKLSAEIVCSTFGVPPFKIGMGTIPAGQKVGDLNQIYYDDALHTLIEEMELCLDEGLGLPTGWRTELDLDNLLRMDPATQADTLVKLVGGAIQAPNEARARMNYGPITGGDTVYLQVQNYSLEALAKRDSGNPLAVPDTPVPDVVVEAEEPDDLEEARSLLEHITKGLSHGG